jgi:hypothetical protein
MDSGALVIALPISCFIGLLASITAISLGMLIRKKLILKQHCEVLCL